MKHNKLIATLAAAGGLFAMNAAHAIAPAIALGIAAISGAAVGSAATQAPPPAVAVVPNSSTTVVLGAPPAPVQEVIPAPQEGYRWQPGHYEIQGGVSAWVPGHWISNDVVIYQH